MFLAKDQEFKDLLDTITVSAAMNDYKLRSYEDFEGNKDHQYQPFITYKFDKMVEHVLLSYVVVRVDFDYDFNVAIVSFRYDGYESIKKVARDGDLKKPLEELQKLLAKEKS